MSSFQVFTLTFGAEWGVLGLLTLLRRERFKRRRPVAGNPEGKGADE